MNAPTVGSLFAGIGGIDLGFERAGFQSVWQVEINPYCRKVLEKHFPHAERHADVREVGAHNLKHVDIIAGGFPCQDISNAGKRAGIDGERSGLWREMHRIIGELRPRFVLVENVAALLGRGISRVLGDLSEIGYDAEWQVISAADVGAPHLRERTWLVAYSACQLFDRSRNAGAAGRHESSNRCEDVADTSCAGLQERVLLGGFPADASRADASRADASEAAFLGSEVSDAHIFSSVWPAISRRERGQWTVEPNVGRVAHGIPARVDRLRALGNAVVPQIPELIARRLYMLLRAACPKCEGWTVYAGKECDVCVGAGVLA